MIFCVNTYVSYVSYVSYPARAQIDRIWDVELPDEYVMPSVMICSLLAADTPSRNELRKSMRAATIAVAKDFASYNA